MRKKAEMNKKAEMTTEQIVSVIIAVSVVILFFGFLFFQSDFLNWIKILPTFGNDESDKIVNVDVPTELVNSACQMHVGKIVNYDESVNYGPGFVKKKNNLCTVFVLSDTCKFVGLYLDDMNIKLENDFIGKELTSKVIGSIGGDIVKINPEFFDLDSDFNRKLRIYSFNKNGQVNNFGFQQSLVNYLAVLDGAHLTNNDLWLCKSNDEYANNLKDADGKNKIKPAWPEKEHIEIITLNSKDLEVVKDRDHYVVNLPDYLNADKSVIYLHASGVLSQRSNSWFNIRGVFNKDIALIPPDAVLWLKGDFLEANPQILEENKIAVRKDRGLYFLSELGGNIYSIGNNFNEKERTDYYETNLRIDKEYYDSLMSQLNKK